MSNWSPLYICINTFLTVRSTGSCTEGLKMYAPDFCGGSGERARRVNKMKSDARLRNIVQRALLFPKTEGNKKTSRVESEKNEKSNSKRGEIILPVTEKIFEKKKTIVMRKEAATQTEAPAAASTACCHKTRLFF